MDELKKQRLAAAVKWGGGLLVAALLFPVALLAAKSIVLFAFIGVTALASVHILPVLSWKFANWKLRALTAEAQEHPIETRRNIAMQMSARILAATAEMETFKASVASFNADVSKMSAADQADFSSQVEGFKELEAEKVESLREANEGLRAYSKETDRLALRWTAMQSALALQRLTGEQKNDKLLELMSNEATKSVDTATNTVMARLELARQLKQPSAKALANNASASVINLTTDVAAKERMHVK